MRLRLLIVDDDPDITELTAAYFVASGHDVDVADSGESAIEFAARHCYDAVMLDLMMPGMSGLEVARQMRALATAPRMLIAVTGRSLTLEQAEASGFTSRFIKPVQLQEVDALLQTLAT